MRIKIGEIRIRFKGISQKLAQDSMEGIGEDVLNLFTQQYTSGGFAGFRTFNIEAIDVGTIECQKGACPGEIRLIIARRIAGLVEAKIR